MNSHRIISIKHRWSILLKLIPRFRKFCIWDFRCSHRIASSIYGFIGAIDKQCKHRAKRRFPWSYIHIGSGHRPGRYGIIYGIYIWGYPLAVVGPEIGIQAYHTFMGYIWCIYQSGQLNGFGVNYGYLNGESRPGNMRMLIYGEAMGRYAGIFFHPSNGGRLKSSFAGSGYRVWEPSCSDTFPWMMTGGTPMT